jgi:hypothetical protein
MSMPMAPLEHRQNGAEEHMFATSAAQIQDSLPDEALGDRTAAATGFGENIPRKLRSERRMPPNWAEISMEFQVTCHSDGVGAGIGHSAID